MLKGVTLVASAFRLQGSSFQLPAQLYVRCDQGNGGFGAIQLSLLSVTF